MILPFRLRLRRRHAACSLPTGCLTIGLIVLMVGGCGPKDTRTRNRVTGAVSYGGKPVAAGEILFTPDGAKQNRGPQGIAIIKDGRYDTKGSRAPGVDGGAMVILVGGYLDEKQQRAFEYEFRAEISHSPEMTLDIDIPSNKAVIVEPSPVP